MCVTISNSNLRSLTGSASMRFRKASHAPRGPPSITTRWTSSLFPYSIHRQSPSFAGSISMLNIVVPFTESPIGIAIGRETQDHWIPFHQGLAPDGKHHVAEVLAVLKFMQLGQQQFSQLHRFRTVDEIARGYQDFSPPVLEFARHRRELELSFVRSEEHTSELQSLR